MAVDLAQTMASSQPAAQDVMALKQVFEAIQAESCPHSFNFHMHTVFSDGQMQPEELMEQAIAIGLKGFAITDHHTVAGYRVAQQWLDDWQQHANIAQDQAVSIPQFWTGTEITSELLGTEVHILGYAFDPNHSTLSPYLQGVALKDDAGQAARVVDAIHQAGGVAVLAHPARYRRSPEDLIPAAANLGIDAVETYYAYTNPSPWKPSLEQTQQVKQLAMHFSLLNTCGTDTHGCNLLQRL